MQVLVDLVGRFLRASFRRIKICNSNGDVAWQVLKLDFLENEMLCLIFVLFWTGILVYQELRSMILYFCMILIECIKYQCAINSDLVVLIT